MKKIFLFFVFCIIFSCNDKEVNKKQSIETIQDEFSVMIINKDSTFGYQILKNGEVFIQQESIPTLMGTKGFKDSADAKKCANIVVNKLKSGIFPPSITKEEIKSIIK